MAFGASFLGGVANAGATYAGIDPNDKNLQALNLGLGALTQAQASESANAMQAQQLAAIQAAQQMAADQQATGNTIRQGVVGRTEELDATLRAALEAMGPYATGLNEADYQNRVGDIQDTNMGAVNEVLDRINSSSRAKLMTDGLADGVTHEANRRSEVYKAVDPLIQKGLSDAYTQAGNEFAGVSGTIRTNRDAALNEIIKGMGYPVDKQIALIPQSGVPGSVGAAGEYAYPANAENKSAAGAASNFGTLLDYARKNASGGAPAALTGITPATKPAAPFSLTDYSLDPEDNSLWGG